MSPCHGLTDVTPFPPAALPAFSGTTASSDSLIPVCLSPFIISRPAYSPPCKRYQGLPGCHVFSMSDMPCSQTPGKLHQLAIILLSLASYRFPQFLKRHLSRVQLFRGSITSALLLMAYGLPARCSTLNSKGHPLLSKNLLPGGWLFLPGRASHPLKHATLPGRTEKNYL